ncbi:HUNK kinase, partial [Polyodon spathula]|nr:HUNK kinase [Polyodon spathula]
MPAAIKTALESIVTDTGDLERIILDWERPGRENQVPVCLSRIPQDVVKNFPHTKRVGNYLVGKMINKGSFAKVMEGLHISTGEKVISTDLSNTFKPEYLSLELLNTQCGSPAYAAPELLAHKKYGPKVDVWSIGVCMFAMLTGTLPFTVEPFNIKQLHQKMINGEISPITPDISKGAMQFLLSFLEPDPAKRPHIKEAMEEQWLNDGYIKRPHNSISYKNRLRPDELNSAVLNYMTENLDFSPSDIINTLINNRPSSIMAAYCLLVRKLIRHHKGIKTMKVNVL